MTTYFNKRCNRGDGSWRSALPQGSNKLGTERRVSLYLAEAYLILTSSPQCLQEIYHTNDINPAFLMGTLTSYDWKDGIG